MSRNAYFLGAAGAFFLLLNSYFSNGIEIGSNGGYKVTIAIENDILPPENVNLFIQQFHSGLRSFSRVLWSATKETFFIESADLLLPPNWEYNGNDVIAASSAHSIASSDIRLSRSDSFYVQNSHLCGKPGEYIQLPYNFLLGDANDGPFGRPAKALLTQWGRYRWGVWEEHGYPDDDQFSYFYRENDDRWLPNTCSNVRLIGEYKKVNTGEACAAEQEVPLDQDCRYEPTTTGAENSDVTSSIMGFHWLNSVLHVCDATSHNRLAPNRQNIFCDYRSVWEVIQSTDDYSIFNPAEQIPEPPNFPLNIMRHSTAPATPRALYILLDKGILREQDAEHVLLTSLLGDLSIHFNNPENLADSLHVSAAVYPGRNQLVEELFPWNQFVENRADLVEFLDTFTFGESANRDFIGSISQAVKKVERLSPENGAIILVIKTGAPGANYFESAIYEEEVATALIRNNIKLHALEVSDASSGQQAIQRHLANLASSTNGYHDTITDLLEISAQVETYLTKFKADLIDRAPAKTNLVVSYKGILEQDTPYNIDLTRLSDVTINLITSNVPGSSLVINGVNFISNPTVRDEWNSPTRERHTYTHQHNPENSLQVVFNCTAIDACDGVNAFLYITEEFPYIGASFPEMARMKVAASASIPDNVIDFNANPSPYVLHAKVELDGQPVRNAIVTATAQLGNVIYEVPLLDDGVGTPDALQFDGIYSANFVPPEDGVYSISVDVTSDLPVITPPVGTNANSGRLLPVDQVQIGCGENGCGNSLTENVHINQNLAVITFANVAQYPKRGIPEKVTQFTVTNINDALVSIVFTAPKVIGGGAGDRALRYTIFGAPTFDDFFEGNQISFLTFDSEATHVPGTLVGFGVVGIPSDFVYFRIQAFTAFIEGSALSAVVRIDKIMPASPPPGPTSPTTSSSTTFTTPGGGDEETFFETTGGIVLIVFLVLLALAAAGGGGFWWYKKKRN